MKIALVNPPWEFGGSVYFGCREPHLPLEFGYAEALLRRCGHEAAIIDAHHFGLTPAEVRNRVADFRPDFTVVATAPTYLFWRCPPPELRLPREMVHGLRGVGGTLLAVGPHASTTPGAVLAKLGVDAVIRGEFEDLLPLLADSGWRNLPAIVCRTKERIRLQGEPWRAAVADLPPLAWGREWLGRHPHHHHRFESLPAGPGAEVEASRGCPYQCIFCAKENFRGLYRRRPLPVLLAEIDHLLAQGVEYVYFIDEIFLPDRSLLAALAERPLKFGIQTRIDIWQPDMLALLGRAGCVSIEAGVESLSAEGRRQLAKPGQLSTRELAGRLVLARRHVPFVQANLLLTEADDPATVAAWRRSMLDCGVWANDPVPLFPYPGSPAYRQLWGEPDDQAWERAHAWYLQQNPRLSELQAERPLPLAALEQEEAVDG